MTPQQLEDLVLSTDHPQDLVDAFAGMAEEDRKKLSTAAQKLHNQMQRGKANAGASERLKAATQKRGENGWGSWNLPETRRAALAVYASGPGSAVKKLQAYLHGAYEKAFHQIIEDRKPDWMDDWLDHELQQEWSRIGFDNIRRWIKMGLCQKPTADGYYVMFASYLMRTGFHGTREEEPVPPITKQLLADPDLMDDIEGLFRVETIAFNTNSWLQKGAADDWETWSEALKKLSDEGHYPREKLLELSLTGLRADIKQNQLSGYSRFFKSMKPTKDELIAHQANLIDLLCSQVGHVQKFAVEMLAKVETAKKLDTVPAVREMSAVFAQPAKGTAISALKLLDKIIKRTAKAGTIEPAALEAVIDALSHENADVQAKAMALLEDHAAGLDESLWGRVQDASSFVLASNQRAFAGLLAKSGDASAEPLPVTPTTSEGYEPLPEDILSAQVLFEEDRITPIASLEELIDTVLHCVEVVDNVDDIERIIDAISRFADQRPDDFDGRVAPMVHRMQKRESGTSNGLSSIQPGIGDSVVALILTWALRHLHTAYRGEQKYYSRENMFVPMIGHLHAIANRIHQGIPRQIMASPTHRGGWIDPLVWVERLQDRADDPRVLESIDLHRSLLRLAPDNRAEALQAVATMQGDIGRLARFALGGEDYPQKGDGRFYPAWLCAARARDPMRDWSEEFAVMSVPDDYPGGVAPAQYLWLSSHTEHSHEEMRWKHPKFEFTVEAKASEDGSKSSRLAKGLGFFRTGKKPDWKALPTVAANKHTNANPFFYSELNTVWISQLMPHGWPLDATHAYFRSARSLVARIDEDSSSWSPSYGLFDALFVKGRPWGEGGHLMLILGLIGKDADAKGLAIDALIEGIDNRTFLPKRFGQVMAKLAGGEWVKLNRLGASLIQVVQASPMHAAAVSEGLQEWLPHFDLTQRNAFHVLQCLSEASAISGYPLTPAMRGSLEAMTGKSKAAKLAGELLSD